MSLSHRVIGLGYYRWLYVAEFADGCVKVGMSAQPLRRTAYIARPKQMGQSKVAQRIIFAERLFGWQARRAEVAACSVLSKSATSKVNNEWFYGVKFRTACDVVGAELALSFDEQTIERWRWDAEQAVLEASVRVYTGCDQAQPEVQ